MSPDMSSASIYTLDDSGHFGRFGGMFVPEILKPALAELIEEYGKAMKDPSFLDELSFLQRNYVGRPSPLYFAERWSEKLGGAKIYLKREDLLHTGAHKINNALGQILLAKRLGKKRIIAETGAGQHGVATATVCARFGMECVVYMGEVDMERQALNVARMEFMGATVVPVSSGQKTLKDAVNEALRDWVASVNTTHYLLGSTLGPHPFPTMVRNFQRCIGVETREQILEAEGRLPDMIIACIGGGSNSMGIFHPFLEDTNVKLVGVEAGGEGIIPLRHAARFQGGKVGVLQGTKTWVLADEDGQILPTHSISAGLDYAAVSPEHAYLQETGRASYTYATDEEALEAFLDLSSSEGIIPALESSHALAEVRKIAGSLSRDSLIICNVSGRGDKDVTQVIELLKRAKSNNG